MKNGTHILKKTGLLLIGLLISVSAYTQEEPNNNDYLAYVDETVKENLSSMPFSIELLSKDRFELYPKNVLTDFLVEFETEDQKVSYTIYNTSGEVVRQKELKLVSAIISIDVRDLKAGTYFIELTSENKQDVQKIIKS